MGRTCLGCRLGRLVACVPLARTRPTTRTARGAAVPRCQILPYTNEKSQVPHKRYLTFLAGAEGLEPSARGFGVDVSRRTRERGRNGVGRFSWTSHKRVVLVWCCGEIWLGPSSGQIATGTIWHSSRIFWISTADSSFFSARVTASFSKKSQLADRISFALR